MTKKNWFMTKNGKIIDLNIFKIFYTEQQENLIVFAEEFPRPDYEVPCWNIGQFETLEESKAYLETIFNQLLDEEYRSLGGEDGDN